MSDELTREEFKKWFTYIRFTKESVDYLGNELCGRALECFRKLIEQRFKRERFRSEVGEAIKQMDLLIEKHKRKPRVSKKKIEEILELPIWKIEDINDALECVEIICGELGIEVEE